MFCDKSDDVSARPGWNPAGKMTEGERKMNGRENIFDGWMMRIVKAGGKYVVCNEIGFRLAAYDENRNVVKGPEPFETKDEA